MRQLLWTSALAVIALTSSPITRAQDNGSDWPMWGGTAGSQHGLFA